MRELLRARYTKDQVRRGVKSTCEEREIIHGSKVFVGRNEKVVLNVP